MSSASASSSDDDDDDGGTTTSNTGPDGVTTITKSAGGVTKTVTAGPDGVKTVIDDGHGHLKTVTIGPGGVKTSGGDALTVARGEDAPFIGYDSHHGWNPGAPWWLVLIGMILIASIVRTAIRARHGDLRTNRQRRHDERAGITTPPGLTPTRENELLAEENAQLRAQATRLEERVRVLERIVTDPAKRVSDEIDALR